MYVCFCNQVTEQDIRDEVARGAGSLADLGQRLGVATGCGRCAGCACAVLAEAQVERRSLEPLLELAEVV